MLVECDPPLREFLVNLNQQLLTGDHKDPRFKPFIVEKNLDDTHLLIQWEDKHGRPDNERLAQFIEDAIDEWQAKHTFEMLNEVDETMDVVEG